GGAQLTRRALELPCVARAQTQFRSQCSQSMPHRPPNSAARSRNNRDFSFQRFSIIHMRVSNEATNFVQLPSYHSRENIYPAGTGTRNLSTRWIHLARMRRFPYNPGFVQLVILQGL